MSWPTSPSPYLTNFEIRRSSSSYWLETNPILAAREIGYELDTDKYKIGDGSTRWAQLSHGGTAGTSPTQHLETVFGNGQDGDLTVSGLYTMTQDMYFRNLTLSANSRLNTNNFRLWVSGTLDVTAAGVTIGVFPTAGASAVNQTGGAGGVSVATAGTLGIGRDGVTGKTGVIGAGTIGQVASNFSAGMGGNGGKGGAGGAGSGGAGGGAIAGAINTNVYNPVCVHETEFLRGVLLCGPGQSGAAGGSGGGDGTNLGRGSGGSGCGGGFVAIYANVINRGASTSAGTIQALGTSGGAGGAGATGNAGGGAGSGGGGGGYIYLCYGTLTGSTATNMVRATGGAGGNGSDGAGTGVGGNGGDGGDGGNIFVLPFYSGAGTRTAGSAGSAGTAHSGNTAGTGGAGGACQVSL